MGFWRGPIQFASKLVPSLAGLLEHAPIVSTAGSDFDADKMTVGNVREKWKANLNSLTDFNDNFTQVTLDASDLVFADGNVAGSGWIDLCKSATTADTQTVYICKKAFKVPYALETGITLSQRFGGQDFFAEMVGCTVDEDDNVVSVISTNPTIPADNPISANISVTSNVATITVTNSVWTYLRAGDWVCIAGCADSRLNVGKTLVTAIGSSANNVITLGLTIADGSYTGYTGGYIRFICPCGGADYHHGTNFYGTSNSNADTLSRNGVVDSTGNNNRVRVVNWNPGNTQFDPAIPNEGGFNFANAQYMRPQRAKGVVRTEHITGALTWLTKDQDSATASRSTSYRESEIPAQDKSYALRLRAFNLPNMSVPVGTSKAITAITKNASTTWTVTCPGHGLTTNDRVRIYGVRDIANFPNLTTDTAVLGVTDADTFTITSTTGTATSYGGTVIRVNGGAVPTISGINIQSYNKSFDGLRLVLTGNTTWVGTYGNVVDVQGLVDSTNAHVPALCGRYRIARIATTLLELEPLENQATAIAAISVSVNAGGTFIQNTSFRIHYARVVDYFRMIIDTCNSGAPEARAIPVRVAGGNLSTQAANISQLNGTTVASGVANGSTNTVLPVSIATSVSNTDQNATAYAGAGRVNGTVVASSRGGGCVISAEVNVSSLTLGTATAVIPILQESRGGTNFTDIWTGDPMTATGIQQVPAIPVAGRRRWCMHSIGGTSTTVTVTITAQELPDGYVKQAYYRDSYHATNALATVINNATQTASTFGAATALTATTQATPWCVVDACARITAQLTLAGSPTVTTQPVISLEVSNDLSNGFIQATAQMTAAGNGTYSCSITGQSWKYARLRVTTAAAYSAGAYTITTASIYGAN